MSFSKNFKQQLHKYKIHYGNKLLQLPNFWFHLHEVDRMLQGRNIQNWNSICSLREQLQIKL